MKTLELKQANGKPLLKSWTRTLTKLIEVGVLMDNYEVDVPIWLVENPLSTRQCFLTPLAHDLYEWIVSNDPIRGKLTRADWDNARYVFNVCWTEEYYALVD